MTMPADEPKQREKLEIKSFLMPAQEEADEEEELMMVEGNNKPLVKNLDLNFL